LLLLLKIRFSPSGIGELSRFWLSCFRPLCVLSPKTFNLFSATILWSMPEEGYSRNACMPLIWYLWVFIIIILYEYNGNCRWCLLIKHWVLLKQYESLIRTMFMARCTQYNIMWSSLSVTSRSGVSPCTAVSSIN
jgi:hypothetical protein